MVRLHPLVWRLAGALPALIRAARGLIPGPLDLMSGKPLERWLLVYDLGCRSLALGNDAHTVETVMLDRGGSFPKSQALEALLAPLIGKGVFGQPGGPGVKEARRLFIRTLTRIADDEIVDVCRTRTEAYVERWLSGGDPAPIPICAELSRLTVDIVSQCTLKACFDESESERFAGLFFDYHQRCLPLLLLLSDGQAETHESLVRRMGLETTGKEMRRMVRQRFLYPLAAGDQAAWSAPFVASLRDGGILAAPGDAGEDGSSRDRALDEITVMLLAGHETTASVMSWLVWELARRPEDQAAAAALFLHGMRMADSERPPASTAQRWCGIDAETVSRGLIREALRLYPPIAFFLREATEEVSFRGKTIPRGSFFAISPWTLQRHRKKWDRPDEFVPERWWQQQREPARTSYMPFGMGPRTCPGAHFAQIEMREILRVLVTRCRFSLTTRETPKPLGNLTSRPDREIYLTVEPRCEFQPT